MYMVAPKVCVVLCRLVKHVLCTIWEMSVMPGVKLCSRHLEAAVFFLLTYRNSC